MKTEWDYTDLAEAYLKRSDYSDSAISEMLNLAGLDKDAAVCDVGAGVAHLTLKLAAKSFRVSAVEPNDAMRALGRKRTATFSNVIWSEGVGEDTGQPQDSFNMVTFGSSFNVTDRPKALLETKRILKPNGWFAAMWNHRDLDDPIQREIESIIKAAIPEYGYGSRREDQTKVIEQSQLFGKVSMIEGSVSHTQTIKDVVEAWESHATLHRQAGTKFDDIIQNIQNMLENLGKTEIVVPYTTRIWCAQLV